MAGVIGLWMKEKAEWNVWRKLGIFFPYREIQSKDDFYCESLSINKAGRNSFGYGKTDPELSPETCYQQQSAPQQDQGRRFGNGGRLEIQYEQVSTNFSGGSLFGYNCGEGVKGKSTESRSPWESSDGRRRISGRALLMI